MLPFLKKRMEGSVSLPADKIVREPDEPKEVDSLEIAMEELFSASSAKDRAAAFRAAFELLEKQPHEEAPHG